ncbi:MAG: tripartite tricarboxylate transporter substrate binding protein [Gammaproteobacteria bacterium]|nr:tripartite tricarboxylate transporter substrate binding protein [Gammaproteobacteria bacterium]
MSISRYVLPLLLFASITFPGTSSAADWPTNNIRMIVPFSAGGSIDRFARGLAQHWEERLDGVSIVVENRSGASGLLGARTFLGSEADGHTMFVGIQPTLSMNIVVQNAPFSLDDFAFVNMEQRDYGSVVVRAESPYQTIHDFVDEARAKPGELSVAMIQGGGTTLFGLSMIQALDLDVRVVTFDGGGELRTNMLGGHSDVTISGAFGDLALGDQVRVLTVASESRFPGHPDAPPINEAYDGIDVPALGDSRFLAVHSSFARENPEAFATLVESYRETFESEKYQAYMAETGSDVISGYIGPDDTTRLANELHEVVQGLSDVLRAE